MAPADQHFGADHLACQRDLRLVVQLKLLPAQGGAQIVFQLRPRGDVGLHLRVKKAQVVASQRFHLVHGDVSLLEQVAGRQVGPAKQRGADGGRVAVVVRAQQVALVELAQDFFANAPSLGCRVVAPVGQVFQQDHKFVAAQTRHGVFLAHAGFQAQGHLLQQQVTHVVPQGVVQGFEMVQVQEQQRTEVCAAGTGGEGVLQAVHQQTPVGQAAQGVEKCQLLNFCLGFGQCPPGLGQPVQVPQGKAAGGQNHGRKHQRDTGNEIALHAPALQRRCHRNAGGHQHIAVQRGALDHQGVLARQAGGQALGLVGDLTVPLAQRRRLCGNHRGHLVGHAGQQLAVAALQRDLQSLNVNALNHDGVEQRNWQLGNGRHPRAVRQFDEARQVQHWLRAGQAQRRGTDGQGGHRVGQGFFQKAGG